MWRDSLYRQSSPIPALNSCSQCPTGLLKYIQFLEFPPFPIQFFVDRNSGPSGSTGVVQVNCWSYVPPSSPDFTKRFWVADIPVGGGSFYFQPTPNKPCISLYKRSSSGRFDGVCFNFVPQSRLFIPQTFS
jgi:hypothetical protein